MRKLIVVLLLLGLMAGCEGGGFSIETMQAALDRSDALLEQADRAVSVAEETLLTAQAAGMAPETLANLQAALTTATATAAQLQETNDQLRADVDEARRSGGTSAPWDKVLTGLITGVGTFIIQNRYRDGKRKKQGGAYVPA